MAIKNLKTGEISHAGLVLKLGEYSFDCGYETASYAVVWNQERAAPETVELGSTRSATTHAATVDATPEILAAYQERRENIAAAMKAERDAEEKELQDAIPSRGKAVRVVRGRKVPIGTEARVFWYGDSGFGPSVGLELVNGSKVFTAAKNVLVTSQVAG